MENQGEKEKMIDLCLKKLQKLHLIVIYMQKKKFFNGKIYKHVAFVAYGGNIFV